MCQNIFDSIHVLLNLCSFLPMKCVHKCVDELHKISCNSCYILITQQRPEGASISSWGGSPTSFFFNSKYLFVLGLSSTMAQQVQPGQKEKPVATFKVSCFILDLLSFVSQCCRLYPVAFSHRHP